MTRKILQFCILVVCTISSYAYSLPTQGVTLAHRTIQAQAKKPWVLEASDGFIITDMQQESRKRTVTDAKLSIISANGQIVLNTTPTKTSVIHIAPVKGSLKYNGHAYAGSLIVSLENDGISLVHCAPPRAVNATPSAPPVVSKQTHGTHTVRVLLDEQPAAEGDLWQLSSAQGFMVSTQSAQAAGDHYAAKKLHIRVVNGVLYLNDKKQTSSAISLLPKKGFIRWGDGRYHGSFIVTKRNGSWLLINNLPLEDYVYCVLKSESWPGWPLEVNKVLAIASRSYALAKITRANAANLPYHILNTNMHQVYAGIHNSPVHKQAVEQTKGVFLSYNDEPIIAMFDSCCGGVIPAHIKGINFKEAPYLKRTYACNFCSSCSTYNWRIECDAETIADALCDEYPRLRTVRNIRVTQKDRAGLVQQLNIKGRHGHVMVPGHRFRALFPKVKSLCFSVNRSGDTYIIKGHGQGHNRGLCQWGAREMVRQGYGYEEILAFYYPKVSFTKLA